MRSIFQLTWSEVVASSGQIWQFKNREPHTYKVTQARTSKETWPWRHIEYEQTMVSTQRNSFNISASGIGRDSTHRHCASVLQANYSQVISRTGSCSLTRASFCFSYICLRHRYIRPSTSTLILGSCIKQTAFPNPRSLLSLVFYLPNHPIPECHEASWESSLPPIKRFYPEITPT